VNLLQRGEIEVEMHVLLGEGTFRVCSFQQTNLRRFIVSIESTVNEKKKFIKTQKSIQICYRILSSYKRRDLQLSLRKCLKRPHHNLLYYIYNNLFNLINYYVYNNNNINNK